jgi:hypothetical protein
MVRDTNLLSSYFTYQDTPPPQSGAQTADAEEEWAATAALLSEVKAQAEKARAEVREVFAALEGAQHGVR